MKLIAAGGIVEDKSLKMRHFKNYRRAAHHRNIEWALSEEEVLPLFDMDCSYCKAPPSNTIYMNQRDKFVLVGGIDRIDNNLGYIPGNITPCCKECNLAKRGMSVDQFLIWVHRIARHTKEPPFSLEEIGRKERSRHPIINDVLVLFED